MPSIRNKPPEKTIEVEIVKGCIANGERTPVGAVIMVSPSEANILLGSSLAVPAKKKPKKKAAKAKPVVDAQR